MMLLSYAPADSFSGSRSAFRKSGNHKLALAMGLILLLTMTHYSVALGDSHEPVNSLELVNSHERVDSSDADTTGCKGTVLLLGDSIGAGYGLAAGESWADRLGVELQQQGLSWVNASVSGETTAGGLRRLKQLLAEHTPSWLILELGGNDGLRGYPIKQLKTNVRAIINAAQQAGARVYVLGMRIPPNYGPRYTKLFHASYQQLAQETNSAYLSFLLEGIGDKRAMMQADGIHPNAAAQPTIFTTVTDAMPDFCKQASAD